MLCIKDTLYDKQGRNCTRCVHRFKYRHLEVDHIVPKTKGGQDVDENLQLLCCYCNRVKGGQLTVAELNVKLKETGMAIPAEAAP